MLSAVYRIGGLNTPDLLQERCSFLQIALLNNVLHLRFPAAKLVYAKTKLHLSDCDMYML